MDEQQGDLIPLDVAARLLMIGPERIRQLSKAGYISIPRPGRTTVVSAVRGYIKFLKEAASKNTQTTSAARAQDARATEVELRVAMRKRDLIPVEDAQLALSMVCGAVSAELSGLPARVSRDMDVRRKVEAEVHASQRRIAGALAEAGGVAATGREASDAGAPDDA